MDGYPYISVWGRWMGSLPHYIRDQQQRARETNAPPDAIFERHHPLTNDDPKKEGRSGQWAQFAGLSPTQQDQLQRFAKQFNIEIEVFHNDRQ